MHAVDSSVEFTIANTGNARIDISGMVIQGIGGINDELVNQELAGFYLSPGETRTIRIAVSSNVYDRLQLLRIRAWSAGRGMSITSTRLRAQGTFQFSAPDCS